MGNTAICTTCPANAAQVFEDILPLDSEASFVNPPIKFSFPTERLPFQVRLDKVRIERDWNSLGVVLSCDDCPNGLTIDEIAQFGCIPDWNEKQSDATTRLRVGDMIMAVNDVGATSEELLQILKKLGECGEPVKLLIDPGPEAFNKTSSEPVNHGAYTRSGFLGPSAKSRTLDHPDLRKYFAILDIAETSSDEAIRRQYRRLARIWHPDKNPENVENCKDKFLAISTAYQAIKDTLRF
mmetsp:Transcript_73243/g.115906  ORF Transcript_73243/g.115906 Transcript_73243/m.115906 type:complete len:239 (-) Transcript_73243:15-731(-)